MTDVLFRDRADAGEKLASLLLAYKGENPLVLSIPKGGVIVGCPVSQALGCPLDVVAVRKLPIPWDPEAGFGAVAADGSRVLNKRLVSLIELTEEDINVIAAKVRSEVQKRDVRYRGHRPFPDLGGRTVVVVDDGIASGYTMLAALESLRKKGAKKLVAAAPVASSAALSLIKEKADAVVCFKESTQRFFAVASSYMYFTELSDDDVVNCLRFKR